jgi:hypothetical protein
VSAAPEPPFGRGDSRIGWATAAAAALVSQQVLGKALRDTLFLSAFGLEWLPHAMGSAAVASGVLVLALSRAAVSSSPRRVTRATLLVSATLLVLAWTLAGRSPRAAAAITYLHAGALSAATASVFWSLVSECFDPHAARSALPRVLTGATLGGLGGGLATWWAATWLEPADLLPVAAALVLATFGAISRLPGGAVRAPETGGEGWRGALGALPYLRALALLVLACAVSQAMLDWLLSSAAVASLGKGPPLLSFFAVFQTAVGVLSFLVQVRVSRRALERFGLGAVLSASPGLLLAGVAASFFGPPLLGAVLVRGTDGVLGASLHRSAYEVLFAPLDARRRRAWKPVLDVGGDRVGMLVGSGIVALVVAAAPGHARGVLLAVVAALAVARLLLSARLQAGYRHTLADNLRQGKLGLSADGLLDRGTIGSLSRVAELDRATILAEVERFRAGPGRSAAPGAGLSIAAFDVPAGAVPERASPDSGEAEDAPVLRAGVIEALRELASGDVRRTRAVLRRPATEPLLAVLVVRLLADDRLARDAADWLLAQRPPPVGLLTDALLDDTAAVPGRRRVARLLGKIDDPRAAEGLLAALPAAPGGVRSGLAQALARTGARRPLPREPLLAAAARGAAEDGDGAALADVFRLLAAAYPDEPVQAAFRALGRGQEERGTALEWLDVVLPREVKAALWPRIATTGPRAVSRPRGVEELRRALRGLVQAAGASAEEGDEDAVP